MNKTVGEVPSWCPEDFDWNKWINKGKNSALLTAARQGSLDSLQSTIAAGADVNTRYEKNGRTPLMEAVIECHSNCVEKLLEMGADVNRIDSSGKTALMFVTQPMKCDMLYILCKLIEYGADVNKKGKRPC